MDNFSRKVYPVREFRAAALLIVMVTVEHNLKPSIGNASAQIIHERSIFVQWVNRPAPAKIFGNCLTRTCAMKGNYGERNWTPLTDFTVSVFKIIRRGEKTRVVITNAEIHAFDFKPATPLRQRSRSNCRFRSHRVKRVVYPSGRA